MKRVLSLNYSVIVSVTMTFIITYYLLLRDNILHISISSIIERAQHLQLKGHLIILGLLPVYIATMIFGAAVIGIYFDYLIKKIFKKLYSPR